MLQELLSQALRHTDPLRGYELLSTLTRLHRVQGSDELVVAAEHVSMMLEEAGLEARAEILRGPLGLGDHYGFWEPRGWRLGSGIVEAKRSDGRWEKVASTEDTPLVVMVHSPGGVVEAKAGYTRPGLSSGEGVAVTDEPGWEGYYILTSEQGYDAVMGFHYGPGVRYWGLYPHPGMAPPTAPAVSLEAEKAARLVGKRVRIEVDAEYSLPVTPVVKTAVGPEGAPTVLLVAHLCHPRPGAHDNASGVAVLAETALAASKLSSVFEEKGLRVEFLLAPEWTGLAAAIQQGIVDTESLVAALSVDMVAASLHVTGGRLRLVASPPPLVSPLDPVLDAATRLADSEAYGGTVPYEWGSDHDIALGHGVAASMYNEWPDKYYHTSLDMPNHIDPTRLAKLSAAIAASLLYLASRPTHLAWSLESYAEGLLSAYLYRGGDAEAARELAEESRKWIRVTLRRLGRGEAGPPWSREVYPARRPPHTRTYAYLVLRDKQLLADSELRSRARTVATIAAAAGTWRHAELYHRLVYGEQPSREVLAKASKLLAASPA